jgi:hypothetical protein
MTACAESRLGLGQVWALHFASSFNIGAYRGPENLEILPTTEVHSHCMKKTIFTRVSTVVIIGIAAVLASCATVSGGTLQKVTKAEQGSGLPPKSTASPTPIVSKPDASKGLTVVTTPDGADVYLNGNFMGKTPLTMEKLARGRFKLEIQKDGYESIATWIDYPGDSMLYQTALVRITGYLSLTLSPPNAEVYIEGTGTERGIVEIPIGSYTVVARAFGYGEKSTKIVILPRSTTYLDIALEPVDFSVLELSALRTRINPDDPGMLGIMEVSFGVSGPGSGEITVENSSSAAVFSKELPPFTTWDYEYVWDLKSTDGQSLRDGDYRFILTGTGDDGVRDSREFAFRIDRTEHKTIRSLWSGSPGLMYAPSAEVLPDGGIQIAMLTAGGGFGTPLFRMPYLLSLRVGIKGDMELGISGGFIFGDSTPVVAGVSGRFPILRPGGGQGFSAAVDAKISFQYNPFVGVLVTDTFANFTGISVGLPLQFAIGPVSLLAGPNLIVSGWTPFDPAIPPAIAFASWAYLRAGILLDFGNVTGGVSASIRTAPFTSGILDVALPFQTAAEVHWLLPSTHVVVSGVIIGEMENASNFYFLGGLGFSLIY